MSKKPALSFTEVYTPPTSLKNIKYFHTIQIQRQDQLLTWLGLPGSYPSGTPPRHKQQGKMKSSAQPWFPLYKKEVHQEMAVFQPSQSRKFHQRGHRFLAASNTNINSLFLLLFLNITFPFLLNSAITSQE